MLCIPIKAPTVQKAISKISVAEKASDLTELWLDQIHNLDLSLILKNRKKPIIIVNKPIKEHGLSQGSETERVNLLIAGLKSGAEYADVDFNLPIPLIRDLIKNRKNSKIILSYHNFEKSPSEAELKKKVQRMYTLGADIAKIAVQINHPEENLSLFSLIRHFHTQRKKIIAIGMGPLGQITRVFGLQFGAYLTYAPFEAKDKTAPGQFTALELKKIWSLTQYKS